MATNHQHLYVPWFTCLSATEYVGSIRDCYSVCGRRCRHFHHVHQWTIVGKLNPGEQVFLQRPAKYTLPLHLPDGLSREWHSHAFL